MIKALLTDIEGTITRISFVKDVLFPYAAQQLPAFVRGHTEQPEVAEQISAVKAEINEPNADIDTVISTLLTWIEEDKKITPLKQLQGLIWQTGYENGDFTGHLYPDAYQFLQQQKQAGQQLYVYSSGSVKAQHLIFQYSDFGDIRSLFSDYFDTKVGAKQAPSAYENIITQLPFNPDEVLFLSDVVAELDAAKTTGLKTLHLIRDGQESSSKHNYINDFSQFKAEHLA
ncbi:MULTISPECIES: acireductone synthase [unclassified Pseudoalteromonas]|jgi:enolase-phosphatase E1|uniref:acireductone synthase n=1 Tax=unclassified Pseudoalteromonas TaxID=194690 RepID=UPI000231813A|nr:MULTISPECIES: acireductone synthase [unclassified Pseudoalteromonas]TMP45470.1 acireductone synthase [Pseudoalteromonas sp. S1688]TMS92596.1 acireductone synthase [Pseudoalteromonas sp. S201]GAA62380.1 enolase-phosphatase E1 [Pseudoalteromonas sp. BSi20311]|tara:strand:+ start:386 stop:1072 length:687 start_codon:yes stop_codon:yes gene_type:complete